MRKVVVALILALSLALLAVSDRTLSAAMHTFAVIVLPDTQYYSLKDPETYKKQTSWIATNRDALNIRFVIHMGDVTDKNTWREWVRASEAHMSLESKNIAYSIMPGNHDFPRKNKHQRQRDPSQFNRWFGPTRFEGKAWYGGSLGSGNANNYTFFEYGTLQFMVVSLEFVPPKDAVCNADKLIKDTTKRRVIVTTHCYQTREKQLNTDCPRDDSNLEGLNGPAILEELIERNPNIFLVLSGHVGGSEFVTHTRPAPREPVHAVLTDYQFEPGTMTGIPAFMEGHHGNGWLRILEFDPPANEIRVRVESVLKAKKFFKADEYGYGELPTDASHQFVMKYDFSKAVIPPGVQRTPLTRFYDRRVNVSSLGDQRAPKIASRSNGDWVAVWEDDSRGTSGVYQIYARRFDGDGCQLGNDFTVNTIAKGQQLQPVVAMDEAGGFVVVWSDDSNDNQVYQIKMRGFDAAGAQRFAQMTVNAIAKGQQIQPAIAMNAAGNFVVAWADDSNDNGIYQIEMRGLTSTGTQRFAPKTVNTISKGQQVSPTVAMDNSGNVVVVWADDSNDNDVYQIKMRGFDAAGNERFSQRTVNVNASGQQINPAIAMDDSGNFVVVWADDTNENGFYQIKVRGFTPLGAQRFSQQTVNAVAEGQQIQPAVAMDNTGKFIVAWADDSDEKENYEIKARRYNADAAGGGKPQQTVNTNARGQQIRPAVTFKGDRYVVSWQDDLNKNGRWEILARGCSWSHGCTVRAGTVPTGGW